MAGISFDLSTLARATEQRPALDRTSAVQALVEELHVHQHYDSDACLVACTDIHPFAQAACDAFYGHYPLIISPDAIWFCIAQGVAQHINLHADTLREQLVSHQGQLALQVNRPDFSLAKRNPWPEVFAAFSSQIATHIGPVHDWLVADFSTTGPVERAASEIVLMEAVQLFFIYQMRLGCGIPHITLRGTVADWGSVRSRAEHLVSVGLDWWLRPLLGVLDALVNTAKGHGDTAFWESFFRYESNSGPAELTGWINVLFPYLKDLRRNGHLVRSPYLDQWHSGWQTATQRAEPLSNNDEPQGPDLYCLPSGLSRAPVQFEDISLGVSVDAHFIGGLFGVVQHPESLALEPEFGWAVVHPPIDVAEPSREATPVEADDAEPAAPRQRLHIVV